MESGLQTKPLFWGGLCEVSSQNSTKQNTADVVHVVQPWSDRRVKLSFIRWGKRNFFSSTVLNCPSLAYRLNILQNAFAFLKGG